MRVIFLFWFLFVAGHHDMMSQASYLRGEIEKIIRFESGIDFNLVPGLVVGVWDHDSSYYFTFGQGVAVDDVFELGSLSKPITAFLAGRAIHAIRSDDPDIQINLCDLLPELGGTWCDLTIEQLLNHQAGLPRDIIIHESPLHNEEDPYQLLEWTQFILHLISLQPVPGKYAYSHLGYSVLNRLFNEVGGLDYFSKIVLEENLGLRGMKWDVPDAALTQGHGFDGNPVQPWHLNVMRTSLGLRSDIKSMMKWMIFESPRMHYREKTSEPLIKKEIKRFARKGNYKVLDGWFLIRSGKSIIRYHTGRTPGHQTSVAFIPSLSKGVAVFASGAAGSNELSLLILSMLKRSKEK